MSRDYKHTIWNAVVEPMPEISYYMVVQCNNNDNTTYLITRQANKSSESEDWLLLVTIGGIPGIAHPYENLDSITAIWRNLQAYVDKQKPIWSHPGSRYPSMQNENVFMTVDRHDRKRFYCYRDDKLYCLNDSSCPYDHMSQINRQCIKAVWNNVFDFAKDIATTQ